MEEAKLEPRLVSGSEAQRRRDREFERPGFGLQLLRGQIEPCQLDPVHRDDFDPKHRLARHPRAARPAAESQPITGGGQLPIRAVEQAACQFPTPNRYDPTGPACPDPSFFETVEHAPARLAFDRLGSGARGR
jgi:hypothetical protein